MWIVHPQRSCRRAGLCCLCPCAALGTAEPMLHSQKGGWVQKRVPAGHACDWILSHAASLKADLYCSHQQQQCSSLQCFPGHDDAHAIYVSCCHSYMPATCKEARSLLSLKSLGLRHAQQSGVASAFPEERCFWRTFQFDGRWWWPKRCLLAWATKHTNDWWEQAQLPSRIYIGEAAVHRQSSLSWLSCYK